jgi:hypothetical protein
MFWANPQRNYLSENSLACGSQSGLPIGNAAGTKARIIKLSAACVIQSRLQPVAEQRD